MYLDEREDNGRVFIEWAKHCQMYWGMKDIAPPPNPKTPNPTRPQSSSNFETKMASTSSGGGLVRHSPRWPQ
eukprot:4973339-Amphidinium_carterae.2